MSAGLYIVPLSTSRRTGRRIARLLEALDALIYDKSTGGDIVYDCNVFGKALVHTILQAGWRIGSGDGRRYIVLPPEKRRQ